MESPDFPETDRELTIERLGLELTSGLGTSLPLGALESIERSLEGLSFCLEFPACGLNGDVLTAIPIFQSKAQAVFSLVSGPSVKNLGKR